MPIDLVKKLENKGVWFSLGAAIAATVVTYLAVGLSLPKDNYIRIVFFERSFIQHTTTLCFWLTIVCIGLKHIRFKHEQRAFGAAEKILEDKEFEFTLTWRGADAVRKKFIQEEHKVFHNSQIFDMIIHGLDRLRKCQSPSEMDDYFRSRSAVNEGELDTGYAGIRYLIWLIPTLGFIGTVLGIGMGLTGFSDIIQRAEGFQQVKASLPEVTYNFATAFDTTLLALVLSAIAVFYMSWMLRREEHMLEKIDMLCLDSVCALFEEHDRASMEIIEAMKVGFNDLRTAMNGNRVDVENVMQHKLPALLAAAISQALAALPKGVEGRLGTLENLLSKLVTAQTRIEELLAKSGKDASSASPLTKEQIRPIEDLLKEIRDLTKQAAGTNKSKSIPDSI